MAELAGQPFVVENRAGAGGRIASLAIVRALADGYTIGLSGGTLLTVAPLIFLNLPFDPARDFTLISGQWRQPAVVVVANEFPARSTEELIELLRRNPGRYAVGHPGVGTSMHLAMELFKARTGTVFDTVAYGTAAASIPADLASGRIQIACTFWSGALAGIRAGQFRALAVTSPSRTAGAPEIPALSEVLPGFDYETWAAIVAPAGLPAGLATRIHELSAQALRRPDLVARFQQAGLEPWIADPEQVRAYRDAQETVIAPIVQAAGIRLD
jgi:tripartite-type tricarboxylate transporter receptor subunit TctC